MEKEESNEYIEEVLGLRICDKCGRVMNQGFCNIEGDLHICESCFESYMNDTYGIECWRQTENDGCDGFYEYLENKNWYGTGIFWTEWELNSKKEQNEIFSQKC